ncbi:MAG: hypothetical protein ABH867_00105 [Patescibacteria group bacterium]|nr:hypothetical protein [Patescibacteria group bacterium]
MPVYAQSLTNPALNATIGGLTGSAFLSRALPFLFTWLIIIALIFFLINLVLAGLNWIQSQGDKAQIETVRRKISHNFIGILVVFSVFLIAKLIGTSLGIAGLENLRITLPTL